MDFSTRFFYLVAFLTLLGPVAILVWFILTKKTVSVEHQAQVRLVVRNVLTGKLSIIGQGMKILWPWEEIDKKSAPLDGRIDLNLEPQSTTDPVVVTSSDAVPFVAEARWDNAIGREFNPVNGEPRVRRDRPGIRDPEDSENVLDEYVLRAITVTDAPHRPIYILGIVSHQMESVIGGYEADELMKPQQRKPWVPKHFWPAYPRFRRQRVFDRRQLLGRLSQEIEQMVNFALRHTGFTVHHFKLTELKPEHESIQRAFEQRQELRQLRQATEELAGVDLSDREKLLVGTEPMAQSVTSAAEVIGAAIRQAAAAAVQIFKK